MRHFKHMESKPLTREDLAHLRPRQRVRVLYKVLSNIGWTNTWVEPMDETVGKVMTVEGVIEGIGQVELNNHFRYPFFCLQLEE